MSTPDPCPDIEPLMAKVLLGEASPEEGGRLSDHLDECPDCQTAFSEMEQIADLTGETGRPEPSERQWNQMWASIEQEITPAAPADRPAIWTRLRDRLTRLAALFSQHRIAVPAGALVLVIAVGLWTARIGPDSAPIALTSEQSATTQSPLPTSAIERYADRSERLLATVENTDPVQLVRLAPTYRRAAADLAARADTLRELAAPTHPDLAQLIAATGALHQQLANMETSSTAAYETIRQVITDRSLIFRLQMRKSTLAQSPVSRPASVPPT